MLYQDFLEVIKYVLETTYDRDDMPQVHHTDIPSAVDILLKNGIEVNIKNILPGKLKASQKQIDKNKVRSIIRDLKAGKVLPTIVVANDGFIVDGHHRKFAYLATNPTQSIKVLVIALPRDAAIKVYSAVENLIS